MDGVEQRRRHRQRNDHLDGARRRAVLVALERVADGDVAFDGESENEDRTEVLRREEDDRKRLAHDRRRQQPEAPRVVELEDQLKREKDEVDERQRRQVAAGRVTHARLDPDEEREHVAGKPDDVPDGRHVTVDDVRRQEFVDGRRVVR